MEISKMGYDELFKLNNEILTVEEMEQLEEHELVTWFENLGESGNKSGCYWYDVQINHPQWENDSSKSINVYLKK